MGDKIEIKPRVINFVNQDSQDKTVLYLKGNCLDAIPLSQTKWYERVQAWFGFGPLSLKNISKFIQDHNNLITMYPDQKKAFSLKLIEKYVHFNQRHSIQKVNNVFIKTLTQNCRLQIAQIASTISRTKPDEILNFAYSNAELGTAYIIDVKGNNFTRKECVKTLEFFIGSYESSLKLQKFHSLNEAFQWVQSQMQQFLADSPIEFDFSWVQKVEINGEFFLLTYQKGTPTIFIKHSDETIRIVDKQEIATSPLSVQPISRTDVIVGVTKGLGDYTTKNTMENELKQIDTTADQLFPNLLNKLYPATNNTSAESASGNPTTKGLKTDGGDDLALFVLR